MSGELLRQISRAATSAEDLHAVFGIESVSIITMGKGNKTNQRGLLDLQFLTLLLSHGIEVILGAILENSTTSASADLLAGLGAADTTLLVDEAVATAGERSVGQADAVAAKVALELSKTVALAAVVATAFNVPVGGDGEDTDGAEEGVGVTAAGVGVEVGAVDVVAVTGALGDISADIDGVGGGEEAGEENEALGEVHFEGWGSCKKLWRRVWCLFGRLRKVDQRL